MKLLRSVFLLLLFTAGQLQAFDFYSDINLGGGYRKEKFRISGSQSFPPGVFLDKQWNDINTYYVTGNYEFLSSNYFYAIVEGDFGWLKHNNERVVSTNTNTTPSTITVYDGAGRNCYTYDFKMAAGYQFSFCDQKYYITPLLGYNACGMKLRNFLFSNIAAGTTSDHHVKWQGVLVGFTAGYYTENDCKIYCGYEFIPSLYRNKFSESNFVITDILLTGNQKSNNAYGNYVYVGVSQPFCENYLVGLKAHYRYYRVGSGTEVTDVTGAGGFDNITWQTYGIELLFGYSF